MAENVNGNRFPEDGTLVNDAANDTNNGNTLSTLLPTSILMQSWFVE